MHKYLKYLIFITILILCVFKGNAQNSKLPPFRVLQMDGKVFKAENLPMGKHIIIIYFAPDCDHCEILTKDIIRNQVSFRKASIAMITYYPLENVKQFISRFSLSRFNNIYVGTEGNTFFLRNYYGIIKMPFAALYTKEGNLVKTWQSEVSIKDVINKLQLLK